MRNLRSITEEFFQTSGVGLDEIKEQITQRIKTVLKDYDYYIYKDTGGVREDRIRINDDMAVDILSAPRNELNLTPDKNGIGFQFGEVNVPRIIVEGSSTTTLEGLPIKFKGGLNISNNKDLKYISNSYGCNNIYILNNPSLVSISGAPKSITGDIYISECHSLKTLSGCPKTIGGKFTVSRCNSLTSLKNMPNVIGAGESVTIYKCESLSSTKGLPQSIKSLELNYLPKLKKLEDIPSALHNFDCSNCISLTSLEGGPSTVDYSFKCGGCTSLTSLEGGPSNVGGDKGGYYFVEETGITNLIGCPKKVGILDCRGCKDLSSLEGFPDIVSMDFRYYGCPNLKFKKSDLEGKVLGKISRSKNG